MRLLSIGLSLLFACAVKAQDQIAINYVWAESGLTMRAAGNSSGDKLMVIPFGAAVELTGEVGELLQVTDLKAVSYLDEEGRRKKSDPYVMSGYYYEVIYQGKQGFVFSGYLSRYNPAAGAEGNYENWLQQNFGEAQGVNEQFRPGLMYSRPITMVYPGGALYQTEEYEGGGRTTIVLPGGSVNDGYLFAKKFWNAGELPEDESWDAQNDYLPEMLRVLDDGTLRFEAELSTTTIRQVGGVVVITSEGGC